jgi:hypothetical protein
MMTYELEGTFFQHEGAVFRLKTEPAAAPKSTPRLSWRASMIDGTAAAIFPRCIAAELT